MTKRYLIALAAGICLCAASLPPVAAIGVALVAAGLGGLIHDTREMIPGDDESSWGGGE